MIFAFLAIKGEWNVLMQFCVSNSSSADQWNTFISRTVEQIHFAICGNQGLCVKSILKGYVTRQVKPIRGVIDLNRLAELFNDFAFVVYQNHEKIEREADKLYKLI